MQRRSLPKGGLWYFCAAFFCLSAAGCLAAPPSSQVSPVPATLSPSPSPSASPTATIVWFPPTATPEIPPTLVFTPTPDQRPGLGEVLFSDDFQTGAGWDLFQGPGGSASIGNQSLTLAVTEPNTTLVSLYNQQVFSDFYLEVMVTASLCMGPDEYGLLFRWSAPGDYYRLALTCDRLMRLDRSYKYALSQPQPSAFSSDVPSAVPSSIKLGIWAVGREVRFFINDIFEFSVEDSVHRSGYIGFYARSQGKTAVTINFSDLVIRQVSP